MQNDKLTTVSLSLFTKSIFNKIVATENGLLLTFSPLLFSHYYFLNFVIFLENTVSFRIVFSQKFAKELWIQLYFDSNVHTEYRSLNGSDFVHFKFSNMLQISKRSSLGTGTASSCLLNELFVVDTSNKGRLQDVTLVSLKRPGAQGILCGIFSNKVINRCNELDQSAVDAPSISAFKSN